MYRFPERLKVPIAGELIEYVVAGGGPATVVLVNGSGGPIEGWHKIFEPLTGRARVFAYNRPGVGGSSKPVVPQTASHMVTSLRSTLLAAGLSPPYVLVGHSLGGLIVNLFARVHPAEVAAVVLIEASSPKDATTLSTHDTAIQRALASLLRTIAPPRPNAETELVVTSVAELQSAPAFPPVPLTVITGSKPAMAWASAERAIALRAEHQRELAGLSPFSRQLHAPRSGHFPQFTEPGLVISAIEEAARGILHHEGGLA